MAGTFLNRSNFPLNKGYVPSMEIRLYGDWQKTIRTIQRMSPLVKQAGIYAQTKIANDIAKRVKLHLQNSDLKWKRLSPEYVAVKAAHGLDSRILIAYGQYFHAIKVWRRGNGHTVFVGVKKGTHTYSVSGRKSRLDIARIAAVHEFSSGKRVPKRPLWNPTIKEIGGVRGLKDMFVKHLVGYLRIRGVPIKDFKNIWH